jgi:hypothetical protein
MIRLMILALIFSAPAARQKREPSPSDIAIRFYRALKEGRYVEGFRLSVYRAAVEGLTQEELRDLEPDFARAFSKIPDKIEPHGEQVMRDSALVLLKFDGVEQPQQVELIRDGNEWLVGDRETFQLVRAQGRAFFFNARMAVNESETFEMMSRIVGAELIYRQRNARYGTLQELIKLGALPADLEDESTSGYRIRLIVSQDGKSFAATATPSAYGRTGRLSFYADSDGVRAEDLKGEPASARSPIYQPRSQ